ncbi:MAG: YqgE/AlgH family protein [Acidimicrobiales bacterium]
MADPNFDRTVVLVVADGADGSLGLVLNRPTPTAVADAFPGWEDVASDPAVVFGGGPVDSSAVICLAQQLVGGRMGEGWSPVAGRVGTLDLTGGPVGAAAADGLRIFAGYAGWGPAQLESEVEAGGWFVVGAEASDVVGGDPGSLWRRVLRRQRSPLALVAAFPSDPADN